MLQHIKFLIQNYMLEHPAHSIFTYNLSSEYKLKNERVRMNSIRSFFNQHLNSLDKICLDGVKI